MLPVVVQQIVHFYRACLDAYHSVAAIDEVTFHRDKDVFAFGKEDFPGLTWNLGTSKGLEGDEGVLRRVSMSIFESCFYWGFCRLIHILSRPGDIPPARIFRSLT